MKKVRIVSAPNGVKDIPRTTQYKKGGKVQKAVDEYAYKISNDQQADEAQQALQKQGYTGQEIYAAGWETVILNTKEG